MTHPSLYRKAIASMWIVVLITLMLVVFCSRVSMAASMNWAQLLRLRNEPVAAANIMKALYARFPSSGHIRWQVASAYASAGEDDNAISILTDSTNSLVADPAMSTLLLDLLVKNGEVSEAIEFFHSLTNSVNPSSNTATAILMRSLTYPELLDDEQIAVLLKRALDFEDVQGVKTGQTEFLYLAESIEDLELWNKSLDGRVLRALKWKSDSSVQATPCELEERKIDVTSKGAELLGVPRSNLNIGSNLASNGSFIFFDSDTGNPDNWQYVLLSGSNKYAYNHLNTNRSAFVTGLDRSVTYLGCPTLRIDGLVIENVSQYDPAVASFQHEAIELPPNTWYMVQFVYRTENMNDTNLQILLAEDYGYPLPNTNGTWKAAIVIAHTGTQGKVVRPTLRSFSLGSVWFADFAVHVLSEITSSALTDEPLFSLVDAE